MKQWGINTVRVPLNEDCWLGINGVSSEYSGAAYQQAIEQYVALLNQNGIYVSVDLHWNAPGSTLATGQLPMADMDNAPAFWTSVATAFKGSGNVMFELYNEPYPDNNQDTTAAWTCWLNGGDCPSVSYTTAGMQTLVDTVRATGATNLILLGGVEYSNGLSQWATYKPTDSLNNLAAAWHVYEETVCNDSSCWESIQAPLAKSFPIVATEVGDSLCDGTFVTSAMSFLDGIGQSYAGWSWNAWGSACADYSIISDSTGTPNGAYGTAFQTHFLSL
jgi:aryl-phospho-beta-D-glucosidase BglC (GH1 family)